MKYFIKHLPGKKEVFILAHSFRGFSPESLGLVWWEHHLLVTRDWRQRLLCCRLPNVPLTFHLGLLSSRPFYPQLGHIFQA